MTVRGRRMARWVPLGWALVVGACAAPTAKRLDFSETVRHFGSGDYPSVLEAWTRHRKVIDDTGTVIEVWATYKSWDFRQAYIERYAAVYSSNDTERAAMSAAQLDATRKTYEFHVVAQTSSHQWNDFEKKTSPWRVTLLDGAGTEIPPASLEIEKLPEIYESQFFPHRTPFSRTYRIRFNRADADSVGFAGPSTGRLVLRIASPVARAEVDWRSK